LNVSKSLGGGAGVGKNPAIVNFYLEFPKGTAPSAGPKGRKEPRKKKNKVGFGAA